MISQCSSNIHNPQTWSLNTRAFHSAHTETQIRHMERLHFGTKQIIKKCLQTIAVWNPLRNVEIKSWKSVVLVKKCEIENNWEVRNTERRNKVSVFVIGALFLLGILIAKAIRHWYLWYYYRLLKIFWYQNHFCPEMFVPKQSLDK